MYSHSPTTSLTISFDKGWTHYTKKPNKTINSKNGCKIGKPVFPISTEGSKWLSRLVVSWITTGEQCANSPNSINLPFHIRFRSKQMLSNSVGANSPTSLTCGQVDSIYFYIMDILRWLSEWCWDAHYEPTFGPSPPKTECSNGIICCPSSTIQHR